MESLTFSSFINEVVSYGGLEKAAAELNAETRAELPKKDFAVGAKKSNTGKPAYPIPDAQHARSALGFAKMHGDGADYAAVRAKVEKKYPDLLKKGGALKAIGDKLVSAAGTHKAELAGLGILAAPSVDEAQAHARAAIAGDYSKPGVSKRTVLPHAAKPISEIAGLGVLAGPSAASLLRGVH